VETKQLKRAVRRHFDRFPADFMFELTKSELANLRCQIGTPSWGGTRYNPMAFTEQGVAMLSGVLNSKRAVEVNIAIMRAFVQLRRTIAFNEDLAHRIKELESHIERHDDEIDAIFQAIKQMLSPP